MKDLKTITLDNIEYVRKDSISEKAGSLDGMDYVLIRTYSAGVHTGYLKSKEGMEVKLINAIRLWQWKGAAACSQLAMEGVSNPSGCKFEMPSIEVDLIAIEIHKMTEKAKNSIISVKSWKE